MTEHPTEQPAGPATEPLPTSDCTVCSHPEAAQIDAGLLGGTTVRATAETYGLSRSSVGRHRLHHLTAEAITDDDGQADARPLHVVEVHGRLAALADRLERVVEQAARTRKATAAVAATRELRQTLVAIAELQATPELQRAASLEGFKSYIEEDSGEVLVRMFDTILQAFGFDSQKTHGINGAHAPERERILAGLMVACLESVSRDGVGTRFADVDTGPAREFVERQARERADRIEAEVQRRVEAELRRREAQARPALEAREVLAIEGGGPTWRT